MASPDPHQNPPFAERLVELGGWIEDHRLLWSERPFIGLPLSWEADEPDMAAALRALPLEAIEVYESRPWELPHMPLAYRTLAQHARASASLPQLPAATTGTLGPRPRRVPERKWQQIEHFVQVALHYRPRSVQRWLDWCGGKGHLGRSMAMASGLPMVCVERTVALCRDGQVLAATAGVSARFVEADVLEADLDGELGPNVGVLALHACGRLHQELIGRVIEAQTPLLVLAPCCYHRFLSGEVEPMSRAGRRAGLELGASNLRLVGLNEVVATPRRQRLRRTEQAYRLGFDLMLRHLSGEDRYRPLGPAPRAWFDGSFETFCLLMAEREGLDVSRGNLQTAEAEGWDRLRITRALGMVRGLFRGPIEAWLLLDRAQHLSEAGWQVHLGAFCPPAVTPRNGMIVAWR